MPTTAKLFRTGHSQAVRLPKAYRLPGDEVWISRNEATGEVTLSPKPQQDTLEAFFALLDASPAPDDYLAKRSNPAEAPRNFFAGEHK